MRPGTIGWVLAALLLFVGQASAQPEKITHTLNVYEAIVTYPGPVWFVGGDPIEASEHFRKQNGPEFVIEQIPKGQSFATWTSMYAVRGYHLAARPDLTMEQFIGASLLLPYERSCGRDNIAVQELERHDDRVMLLFTCQNSPGGPGNIGYGDGIGELAIYKAFKVKSTFVEVFQKWRGPAFKSGDTSTWPAPVSSVNRVIALFQKVSAVAVR